jgi:hypothetical protein
LNQPGCYPTSGRGPQHRGHCLRTPPSAWARNSTTWQCAPTTPTPLRK